jgi:hypothetical protein
MNLIEVFALFATTACTLFICICLRINRRKAVRAQRMMRCLELAIRAEAELFEM